MALRPLILDVAGPRGRCHHYDRTDPHLVWEVLSTHIPELARLLGLPEDPDGEIPLPGEGA